jgi:hypothetical protein
MLGLCDPDEDADLMIAYSQAQGTIDAYESQLQEDEMERQRKKNKGRR